MNNMTTPDTDEFSMLNEAALEAGLKLKHAPKVERVFFESGGGSKISALKWGEGTPELVLLHGGSQNAHTWDTVAMALKLPLLAVDLPGHGHSDWRKDHSYSPQNLAEDILPAVLNLAAGARGIVGMSLGGLAAVMLLDMEPKAASSLMLVDITPGVDRAKAEPILEFISGPQEFESFEEILEYTVKYNPSRSKASLIRGIKNNAKEIEGGKWTWRWDPAKSEGGESDGEESESSADMQGMGFKSVWQALEKIQVPVSLYKGEDSKVVDEKDLEDLLKCQPSAEVVIVPGAGHSIQGDKPLELAELISSFLPD